MGSGIVCYKQAGRVCQSYSRRSACISNKGLLKPRQVLYQLGYNKSSRIGLIVYTNPETETEASPLDYPQEWVTPQPSRRPDTQPEFERLETPMPKPMPGDPEQPEEEEAEEEEKRNPDKQPDKDNPDEEDPDKDEPKPDTPDTPPE